MLGSVGRSWRAVLLTGLCLWLVAAVLLLTHRNSGGASLQQIESAANRDLLLSLQRRLDGKSKELTEMLAETKRLAGQMEAYRRRVGLGAARRWQPTVGQLPRDICVLVMACNRPTVARSLRQILRYKDESVAAKSGRHRFPVVVSQDGDHRATEAAIREFGDKLTLVRQPDQRTPRVPARERGLVGYYRIARHFRWALDHVFLTLNHSAVILVEDDLDIAPDFFDYFANVGQLLTADKTLWCVSAWNDNGKSELIDTRRADLFYRTDFFPGLGWMLLRELWLELRTSWPASFWDDHLRKAAVRRGRSCVRPEVSRSFTFGKVGVSRGQFYDKFLRFIQLNSQPVDYAQLNLSYLFKDNYDRHYVDTVYSQPAASLSAALSKPPGTSVRVEYSTKAEFVSAATALGAMADFKDGVPRCAYKGVVSIYRSGVRLHLAPRLPWPGYDASWK